MQVIKSGTSDKFASLANMLEDVGKPKLAAYMRQHRDETLLAPFTKVVLYYSKPEKAEETLWKLEEIGALK